MDDYAFPVISSLEPRSPRGVVLVASGDQRQEANRIQWPVQAETEARVVRALRDQGADVWRANDYDPRLQHGFIWSQRMGMDVFAGIDPDSPVVVVESVWQYSHHVLPGLRSHPGPILTVANWSGKWSGLVGVLNLNASLAKAGVRYSTLWTETFEDAFFVDGLRAWLKTGCLTHDVSHVRDLVPAELPGREAALGRALAAQLRREKAILGVFDEGCMGMYNAIVDDELLNPCGLYKERLSQSALVAAMRLVRDEEADAVRRWVEARGLRFVTGPDPAQDLTDSQIREQCRMYIAAVRMADEFGCDAIGIQYQQGLKDMTPASDLVEGLLNNAERPPVCRPATGEELFPGRPLPHFNEADEGAAVDALITNRVWTAMGLDPATTLHDIRWGERFVGEGVDDFVWVFMISGAAPPSHFIDGYRGATSVRQPPMYFPLGGGTLRGVCKPGEIVWSRVFVEGGRLQADLGRGSCVALPVAETDRRWKATSPEWPILHAVLHGVSRDQMMARHRANHVNVAYAPTAEWAEKALAAKAAMLDEMGLCVHLCGV